MRVALIAVGIMVVGLGVRSSDEVAERSKAPERVNLDSLVRHGEPAEAVIPVAEAPAVQSASPESSDGSGVSDQGQAMAPVASSVVQEPTWDYPAEMVDAICNQGFSWPCGEALEICWLEMGRKYQPWAVNPVSIGGNHATGLCQIMLPYPHAGLFNGTNPLNPYHNANAAYQLWTASGGTFCRHWSYWC